MGFVSKFDEQEADEMDLMDAIRLLDPERLRRLADYAAGLKAEQNRH